MRVLDLAALLALGLCTNVTWAQTIYPPHAYWQIKPAANSWSRMRYRIQLNGRGYCTAATRGYLTAPNCNEWWDRSPRLNTWQVWGYGQWDFEIAYWSAGSNTPVMYTPLALASVGRQFGCSSAYLAASRWQCSGRVRMAGSSSSRWQLEPVPGRPYAFYISSLHHEWGGCSRRYLGAAKACGKPENAYLGLYSKGNAAVWNTWTLIPVAPCALQGAACTVSGTCCRDFGLACVSGVCGSKPGPPGLAQASSFWDNPNLTVQVDLSEPTSTGGLTVTKYTLFGEWGSGADYKYVSGGDSTTGSFTLLGSKYPWLCGKAWKFTATCSNGAGTSNKYVFTYTTENCLVPEGVTYNSFTNIATAPISLDVNLNAPTNTYGLAVTKYSVRMEYLAAGQAGYLKYEASSTTTKVTFPGSSFPLLCGRTWATAAWATTSAGNSAEEVNEWVAPACPLPDPPAGVESVAISSTTTPPVSLTVVVQASPQTWGFDPTEYAVTLKAAAGGVPDCGQRNTTRTLVFAPADCPDLCSRTWSFYLWVDTASGQTSAERELLNYYTVPAC